MLLAVSWRATGVYNFVASWLQHVPCVVLVLFVVCDVWVTYMIQKKRWEKKVEENAKVDIISVRIENSRLQVRNQAS